MPARKLEPEADDALDGVVSAAKRQKVGEFEAFAIRKRARRVTVDSGRLSGSYSTFATGLHIRVSVGGRVGGAFCNKFDAKAVARCMAEAVKIARLMEPDERWKGFPSCDRGYPSVSGMFERSIASLDMAVMGSMAEEMVEGTLSVSKEVSTPYGAVDVIERSVAVCNSSGISSEMSETELDAAICAIAGSGSSVSPECERSMRSRGTGLRCDKMGEMAGWVAERSSALVKGRTEECEVVFSPQSLGSADTGLLNIVLSKALSGQNAQQGTSFLAGESGKALWSENVTINDNPVLSGRCGSRPMDDEGMPTGRRRLVDRGMLKGFVWDSYSGAVSGEGSTGNAVRDMASGTVSPAPLNLQLAPGRGTLSSLIGSVDRGYLVWGCQGAHTSNTETGDFSFVASPGLRIERGETVGGVRGVMISGNVSDLMSNVERVGADVEDFGNALIPSVLFSNVRITTG